MYIRLGFFPLPMAIISCRIISVSQSKKTFLMFPRLFVPTIEPRKSSMKSNGNYLGSDLSWAKFAQFMIKVDTESVPYCFVNLVFGCWCAKVICHRLRRYKQRWSGKPNRISSNGNQLCLAKAHFLRSKSSESGTSFF